MSTQRISTTLAALEAYLRGKLGAKFADITTAEFPFCEDFPALHVNAGTTADDTSAPGMGLRERKVQVRLFVTLQRAQVRERGVLWDLVDDVRDAVLSDPFLGGLTRQPVIKLPVSPVPSPTGSAYSDCRQLSFEITLLEQVL
ncbi:hypothetical protein [Deinococcus peraridilitoris]|uniref:Uncharacterized protein n=1 Tax=Deinococcus peraridilitoris (strain DSM 19664 / LMG 22246 / CIP 109416 / KR-200) TaxID=937777 RepID=L0A1U4_DEIPD|nr:hypothetical protein [Deinococcus peraridilitoris]AFZ66985.1 hypothetical protein Deipe_1444 [Deinococcus peraridilitoris DSM 19664]